MVIDAAKGVEDRTRKLMEVARLRAPHPHLHEQAGPAKCDPMEVMDEVESAGAQHHVRPHHLACWLVANPFKGVYHLYKDETYLYPERSATPSRAWVVKGLNNPSWMPPSRRRSGCPAAWRAGAGAGRLLPSSITTPSSPAR